MEDTDMSQWCANIKACYTEEHDHILTGAGGRAGGGAELGLGLIADTKGAGATAGADVLGGGWGWSWGGSS